MSSGKRAIGAAAGNPPVVVDETANPEKAAHDIVAGSSFDNNLPCIAEKEIIVVEWMADALLRCFQPAGGMVLDASYLAQLEKVVLTEDQHPNRKYVGKNAAVILRELGIDAGDEVRTIIVESRSKPPPGTQRNDDACAAPGTCSEFRGSGGPGGRCRRRPASYGSDPFGQHPSYE